MIVAFSGLAGVGKDTAADHLVKNSSFVKVALADPLKRICADVFEFTEAQLWGPSESRDVPDKRYLRGKHLDQDEYVEMFLTPRYALQKLGTEWGRDCFDPIWVHYALRLHEKLQQGGCYYDARTGLRYLSYVDGPAVKAKTDIVISDVRFKNEVLGLKGAGARVFRILRPKAGLKGAAALHASEQEQLDIPDHWFDGVIHNDGSLDAFYEKVAAAVPG